MSSDSSNSSCRSSSSEEPAFTIDIEKVKQFRQKGQRSSVSAEVYGMFNQKAKYVPPCFPKDASQEEAIIAKLSKSFMFSALGDQDKQLLV